MVLAVPVRPVREVQTTTGDSLSLSSSIRAAERTDYLLHFWPTRTVVYTIHLYTRAACTSLALSRQGKPPGSALACPSGQSVLFAFSAFSAVSDATPCTGGSCLGGAGRRGAAQSDPYLALQSVGVVRTPENFLVRFCLATEQTVLI